MFFFRGKILLRIEDTREKKIDTAALSGEKKGNKKKMRKEKRKKTWQSPGNFQERTIEFSFLSPLPFFFFFYIFHANRNVKRKKREKSKNEKQKINRKKNCFEIRQQKIYNATLFFFILSKCHLIFRIT